MVVGYQYRIRQRYPVRSGNAAAARYCLGDPALAVAAAVGGRVGYRATGCSSLRTYLTRSDSRILKASHPVLAAIRAAHGVGRSRMIGAAAAIAADPAVVVTAEAAETGAAGLVAERSS